MSEEEVKPRTGKRRTPEEKAVEPQPEPEPQPTGPEGQVKADPKLAKKIADFYWKDLNVGEFISVNQLAEMFKADVHVTGITVTSYMPDNRLVSRMAVKSFAGPRQYDDTGLIGLRLRRGEFERNNRHR